MFPDAEVKIYLTARSENRAERRALELGMNKDQLVQKQQIRDQQDSTRKAAPLQIPDNAIVLDTTDLNFDQVVSNLEKHVRENWA